MENTARKFQNEETISLIKEKLDISTLNNFLITSPEKAITFINYWKGKMQNATPEQKQTYQNEISKCEALMSKMADLSLDVYDVNAVAWLDAKGVENDKSVAEVLIDVAAEAEENETPIVSIFSGNTEVEKPKLSEISQACKGLLRKGARDSAKLLADKYFSVGSYIPKKEKQEPRKWSEKEIESWLKDLEIVLLEEKKENKKPDLNNVSEETDKLPDPAAKGLTSGEVENLRLLNRIMPSSLAGHGDYESRRAVLEKYLHRSDNQEDEAIMLDEYAKRIAEANAREPKISEMNLASLFKDLEAFQHIFFQFRGYTEKSINAWKEIAKKEPDVNHFEYLKAKEGVVLFKKEEQEPASKRTDPDLANARTIKSKDKIPVSEVHLLLSTIYENGGIVDDAKEHPEILNLIGKEIEVDPKSPVNLKFAGRSTLDPWIQTQWDVVVKKIGPIKVTTDKELTEQVKMGDLNDFLLLIETAANNDVTEEDFIKEHKALITNEKGQFMELTTKNGNSKFTKILTSDKDLKEWVHSVYEVQEKKRKHQAELPTLENEKLATSFKELIIEGKDLLKKGTPYKQFMEWLNKNILNRKLKEQKEPFKDPKMVEQFAKGTFKIEPPKEGEETEKVSKKQQYYTKEDIDEIIAEEAKSDGVMLVTLVRMMRDLYVSNKLVDNENGVSLKDVKEKCMEIFEKENPTAYARYMEKLEEKSKPEQTVLTQEETKDAEHKVFERKDIKNSEPDLWAKMAKFETLTEVYNMAVEFEEAGKFDEALSMCIEILPNLEESKGWNIEQITDWYNKVVLKRTLSPATEEEAEVEELTEATPDDTAEKDVWNVLKTSNSKRYFKQAIGEILKSNTDSTNLRDQIIEAIKTGTGSHVRQVGKMPDSEMHKMINNIKEKVGKSHDDRV